MKNTCLALDYWFAMVSLTACGGAGNVGLGVIGGAAAGAGGV